jgi:hypothetical protein
LACSEEKTRLTSGFFFWYSIGFSRVALPAEEEQMTKTQIPFGDDNQNGKDNSNSKAEARRWRANYLHPTLRDGTAFAVAGEERGSTFVSVS